MDTLVINLDVANKKGNYTAAKAIGAYEQVFLRVYNFAVVPDLTSLKAVIYLDDNTPISICSFFVPNVTMPTIYEATLTMGTDASIAFFSSQKPNFSQDLTLVMADSTQLYCNSKITIKNNPNAVPTVPQPVVTYFITEAPFDGNYYVRRNQSWVPYPEPSELVVTSAEGFSYNLQGELEQKDVYDDMTAGEVRIALITLVKHLKAKGVI